MDNHPIHPINNIHNYEESSHSPTTPLSTSLSHLKITVYVKIQPSQRIEMGISNHTIPQFQSMF